MASDPAITLTEYQRRWVRDASRFKIGVITRQGGKSFGTSLEAVDDIFEKELLGKKTKWVFLSAGERQSKELMATAAMHAQAYGSAIEAIESDFLHDDEKRNERIRFKQLEIAWPKGSRIVGLPANPATARGHSANILLDEFAFHKDSRAIWKALFPTITRGYKIRIISTFQGKTNKFYELLYASPTLQRFIGPDYEYVGERGGWSKHIISIHDAIRMGLELKDENGNPIEAEDLRLALNDEDAWLEEFECIPSDEASSFLSHDLISGCEDVRLVAMPVWATRLIEACQANYAAFLASKVIPPLPMDVFSGASFLGELFLGMDIGRKRDLSVIWVDQKIGEILHAISVIELRAAPYFVQQQVLHSIMALPFFRRGCIDSTGIGNQLAESSVDLYGSHRVEEINFNPASKEVLAEGLKRNFEDRGSLIPADATIRRSLHSVKKYGTGTGHFRFDADGTEATGHADHFWAKALSAQAASGTQGPAAYGSVDPDEGLPRVLSGELRKSIRGAGSEGDDDEPGRRRIFSGFGRLIRDKVSNWSKN